jgi:tetratricopeptide (TPR) repeat protein
MSSFKGHIDQFPPAVYLLIVIGIAVLVTTIVTGKPTGERALQGDQRSPVILSPQDTKETATIKDHRPYAKDAVNHYNAGVEAHQHGFVSRAVTEYKAAIEADNRMEEAYSNLGVIYAAQHSYDKALECFQRALQLVPNRSTTLNGLGSILYGMGRVDEAIEKWRRVIEIDPNFKAAYYNLAKALKETGHGDEAQKVLDAEPKG